MSDNSTDITIENQETQEILVFGPIGSFGVNSENVTKTLSEHRDEDVLVTINSQGGDVTEGLAIANALRSHPGKVTTHIVGSAFSMASGIAVAGDVRQMAENALFMLHEARVSMGNAQTAEELAVLSDLLRKRNDALLGLYADAAGGQTSRQEIKEMMAVNPGTFLTATEAKNVGFIDEITAPQKLAASVEGYDVTDLPVRIRKTYSHMFVEQSSTDETEAGEANFSKDEPMTTTDEKVAQPVAVTSQMIREACPGASDTFILSQLDEGADMAQVQKSFADFQKEKIAELEKKIADLENTGPVVVTASDAPAPVAASTDDEVEEIADSDDPIEAYNRTCDEVAKRFDIPLNEAKQRVKKQHPQLVAAYVDAFNASPNGATK